jgi:hypothetical protein
MDEPKKGRLVARLVACLLATAAPWLRIQTNLNKYKMGDISKEVANTLEPAKKMYRKNLSKLSLTPRINKDLQSESGLLKRKAPADTHNSSSSSSSNGPPVRKVRPSNAENEADIQTLEKEIRALHWLARRKEQEWDQVRSRCKSTGITVLPGKNQT